jgi:hypothetical protein
MARHYDINFGIGDDDRHERRLTLDERFAFADLAESIAEKKERALRDHVDLVHTLALERDVLIATEQDWWSSNDDDRERLWLVDEMLVELAVDGEDLASEAEEAREEATAANSNFDARELF